MHPPGRKCTPEAAQWSNFWGNWGDMGGGRDYLDSFSVCFDSDNWKKVVNFLGETKCTLDKILATPIINCDIHSIDPVRESLAKTAKPALTAGAAEVHNSGLRHSKLQRRCRDVPMSRFGLGHLLLVPKTNFRPNCEGHIKNQPPRRWRSSAVIKLFKVIQGH